jgi:Lipocalin-like domain
MRTRPLAAFALALPLMAAAPPAPEPLKLSGTWVMQSAYEIRADGTRTTNYGEHPLGLMMVDRAGRYSIQIFRPGRPAFASGVKAQGQPEEYREAVLGSSTHFGHVTVDAPKHQLQFDVEASSFPNWEGKRQLRDYTYANGVLTYAVPASASGNGTIAYSVWRRLR